MEQPLVTIICLCYNHERFVEQALRSVLEQSYPNKEIIVVDDCSIDGSVAIIEKICGAHTFIQFIRHSINKGNCASFNEAFELSKGTYIIDFATDDILLPGKIEKQVQAFQRAGDRCGVVYSDAEIISESGEHVAYHHKNTRRENKHPEGIIFADLVGKYFICPPTMMIRRSVLEYTNGYDATLAYEDFDFWIKSSRRYEYAYVKEPLIQRRIVAGSLSSAFYKKGDSKVYATTVKVLYKVLELCETEQEKQALVGRVRFEMRHSILMQAFATTEDYKKLLTILGAYSFTYKILYLIGKFKIPLYSLYFLLLKIKNIDKLRR